MTETAAKAPDMSDTLGVAFTHGPAAMVAVDASWRVVAVNRAAESLCGWAAAALIGRCVWGTFLVSPSAGTTPGTTPPFPLHGPMEATALRPDGEAWRCELTAALLPRAAHASHASEDQPHALLCLRDVSQIARLRELWEAEARRLREQALTDALTGLGNRFRLLEAGRTLEPEATVAMLDVDNMKTINDGCGHQVGDRVLQEIATVLRRHTRQSDVAVRYGGDEFVLLLPKTTLSQAQRLMRRLERLMNELGRFLEIPGGVSVSYGLTTLRPAEALEDAIVRADRAMYRRKMRRRARLGRPPAAGERKASRAGAVAARRPPAPAGDRTPVAASPEPR